MRHLFFHLLIGSLLFAEVYADPARPNVIIIVTDDQGFGELGVTGNPVIHTSHIDRFAAQSASLTSFHVMPVCSPTRACLMTGRYNYRTGVVDTFQGRSLLNPAEKTLPEMLAAGGYRTGIFGKWHLGDNYPMRAMDRGFQESLVLNGGGLAQPGDPPDPADERGAYFNATLRHNGAWVKTDGYVSDVITRAATDWVAQKSAQPFFAYLAFNCPHAPHQVPEEYRQHYPAALFTPGAFPQIGHPMSTKFDVDDLAHVYGMVENIDDNVGRLLAKLDELKLAENTIVVLFSDNGCQQHNGYNAGFQGWKATPFEGGIHQFCFVRWPAAIKAGQTVTPISAHIDLSPTLLDLCHVPSPAAVKFDGRSLAPLLRGEPVDWPDRTLFFQWHRGDAPERYRACAARSPQWKLVQPLGSGPKWEGKTDFQLYDMAHDPLEMRNVAAEHPEEIEKLKGQYDAWFDDVTKGVDYTVPSRISLGAAQENPVLLTRQDRRVPKLEEPRSENVAKRADGYWEVNVAEAGTFEMELRFDPPQEETKAVITWDGGSTATRRSWVRPVTANQTSSTFAKLILPAGPLTINARLLESSPGAGVNYVIIRRRP